MDAVVQVILPVFGMVLAGYALGRTPLLDAAGLRGFNHVAFYILFPCLLFRSMSRIDLRAVDPEVLLAYYGGSLSVLALTWLVARFALGTPAPARGVLCMSAAFSNTVGLGIPLVTLAYGESGLAPLLMIVAFHSLIVLTLGVFLVEIGLAVESGAAGGLGARMRDTVVAMLKHPVLLPIAAGLAWGQTGLALPGPVDKAMALMAAAAPPCGLIMLGASLAFVRVAGALRDSAVLVAIKLLLFPGIVWLLATHVLDMPPLWQAVAVIAAALPAGANVYLIAQKYGVAVDRATTAVVLSTALSVATLSVVVGHYAGAGR